MSDYVLTSSMQARSIVAQGRASLVALAKNDFRTAIRGLYQGVLEKQRLDNYSEAKLFANAAEGTADASIVNHALATAHAGWQRLSLAVTGDRRLASWDTPIAKLLHQSLYSYVHGFAYTATELRGRYADAQNGATDTLIDIAVGDPDMPLDYAAELIEQYA